MNTKDTNPKDLVGQTKANLALIPPVAEAWMAEALMDGARKYEPYNWREKGVRATVYLSACKRHINAFLDGEERAPDSKVHHLGHAMACLAILSDAFSRGNVVDDRPVAGTVVKEFELLKQRQEEIVNEQQDRSSVQCDRTDNSVHPQRGKRGGAVRRFFRREGGRGISGRCRLPVRL